VENPVEKRLKSG